MDESNSILTTIKKLLGLTEEDTSFDTDIIVFINSAFTRLNQLGVGPEEIFKITDSTDTWEDFWGTLTPLPMVIDYIYLKVKRTFDPPSSSVLSSIDNMIKEYEFELNTFVDPTPAEVEAMNLQPLW